MEATQAPSPVPAAGGSGKRLWVIVGVIILVAVLASATTFLVLPALQGPPYAKFTLTTLDFAYDRIDFNPEHHVKVNQPIWVVMTNEGDNDHEFLLYADKDSALVS